MILKKNRIVSAFVLLLLLSFVATAFFAFMSTSLSANAQTTPSQSDLLQYEWPNPNADPTNTYYSSGPGPSTPNLEWSLTIPGLADQEFHYGGSTLTAFNGMLFFSQGRAGNFPGMVAAIDAFTGRIVWKKDGTSGTCVKIDDTYMMLGSRCVRITNGETVWNPPSGFSGTYVPELQMFVGTSYGWSLSDPSQAPTLVWNRTSEQNVHPGYTCYGDGKLFIGSSDAFLHAIDATTGIELWRTGATTAFSYGMSYYEGKIIHGGLDNNMRAWDANNGTLLWTYNPGSFYGQWASGTAVGNGMVYEHNQDTYVYAINATNGQLVWRQKGPGIAYSNKLTIASDKLYVQQGENEYRDFATGEFGTAEFDCFNALNGDLLWSIPVECQAGPGLAQCNAFGNLYMVPSYTSKTPGVYFGGRFIGEIWCISSKTKDWNMFLADPQHSGVGAGPQNLTLLWKFQAGGQIVSNPAVVNGVAYFGSTDGNVYAVDAVQGTQKWAFQTGFAMVSSPAVVDGKVYTGADSGSVYCLDAATGKQVWKAFAGNITNNILGSQSGGVPYSRSSPVVVNNKVYVGSLDKNVYCFSATSGSTIWTRPTNGIIRATVTVVDNAVYVGACSSASGQAGNGTLFKLEESSGNIIWQIPIPYSMNRTTGQGNYLFASPTVADGRVFIRSGLFYTFCVNATTGSMIWKYEARFNEGTPGQTGGVIQINAPLYAAGKVFMNDFYGIVCLDASNGTEIWYSYLSRENVSPGLAYSFGRIYTVAESRVLYVLDAQDGSKISYYENFGSQMHSNPSLYNGSLYVGCRDWNLYCFGDARFLPAALPEPSTSPIPTIAPTTAPTEIPVVTPAPTSTPVQTVPPIVSPTPAVTPEPTSTPTAENSNALLYTGIAVVIVIAIIAAIALFLRKRK